MKKLYRKGTAVHPSPPPPPDQLSFLPAAIFVLAAALSPEDREVLAYLLLYTATNSSSSAARPKRSSSRSGGGDHAPEFGCDCFRCYMSYWGRWDSSPNRQLIHDIIEAYEDHHHPNPNPNHQLDRVRSSRKAKNGKKERKNNNTNNKQRGNGGSGGGGGELNRAELAAIHESPAESVGPEVQPGGGDVVDEASTPTERGSNVRRLVGFIGEKIWGVWS